MGFVWFQLQKETDWRINSSGTSDSAFKPALQAPDSLTRASGTRLVVPAVATAARDAMRAACRVGCPQDSINLPRL